MLTYIWFFPRPQSHQRESKKRLGWFFGRGIKEFSLFRELWLKTREVKRIRTEAFKGEAWFFETIEQ